MLISNLRQTLVPFYFKGAKRLCTKININYPKEESQNSTTVLNDVIKLLNLKDRDVFLDMTFGSGGHSSALLKRLPQLKVIALDRDPKAYECALMLKEQYPEQVIPLLGTFSDLPELLKINKIKAQSIDAVLFDLGCSSFQLEDERRGFSLSKDGLLDLRMDGCRLENALTAADILNHASEEDLREIFNTYGERRILIKIARAIVVARQIFSPLKKVSDLCGIIESVCAKAEKEGKVTNRGKLTKKAFQALRIFVNNELNELNYGIELAHRYLKDGGRAVVLTFNVLEDTIVKRHFKNYEVDNVNDQLPLMFYNEGKLYTDEEVDRVRHKSWNEIFKKIIFSDQGSTKSKIRAAIKISETDNYNSFTSKLN